MQNVDDLMAYHRQKHDYFMYTVTFSVKGATKKELLLVVPFSVCSIITFHLSTFQSAIFVLRYAIVNDNKKLLEVDKGYNICMILKYI